MEYKKEISRKHEKSNKRIFNMLYLFGIPILFSISIFISCNSETSSPEDDSTDSYLFIEILRNTNEKALNDSCGYLAIDHCPYTYDSNTGILTIELGYYSIRFDTLGTSKFVLTQCRTIDGDRWSGNAGWVYTLYHFPFDTQITSFPLPYKDSIKIENYDDNGSVTFEYDSNKVILEKNNEWRYLREYDLDFYMGLFHIKDEFVVKNHGWLKKLNVVLLYNNSWSKHNEKDQSFIE
jgi:hypothetical protein